MRTQTGGRNALIGRMFEVQPALSLTEVGGRFGITRERVRQILSSEGGHAVPPRIHLRKRSRLRRCREEGCSRLAGWHKLYCPEHDSDPKPYTCQGCGEVFYQLRNQVEAAAKVAERDGHRRDGPFCSRKCLFTFFGAHYGWGTPNHPQQQKCRFWDAIFALMSNGQRINVPWKGERGRAKYYNRAKTRGIRIHTKRIGDTLQVWRRQQP